MASIQIRNVPDGLYRRLRVRAKADRRSLQQEAAWLLEHALQMLPAMTPEERWAETDAMQEEMKRLYGTLPDSTPDIRAARDSR